jgi:hypothetical protein
VLYARVFLSVINCLFFEVKRAKRLKIVRTSFGYHRTFTKLTSYSGLMLMFSIADMAARLDIPGAKAIYEELKKRFPVPKRKSDGTGDDETNVNAVS